MSELSPAGLAFLQHEEGIRRTVYNDRTGLPIASYGLATGKDGAHPGYPTIGMGLALLTEELRARYVRHLAAPAGRPMDDGELAACTREALEGRTRQLNELLTVAVSAHQWDALFSFMFNRGAHGHGFPSAIAETNAGNPGAAAAYIAGAARYETNLNIQARRRREAELYLGPVRA